MSEPNLIRVDTCTQCQHYEETHWEIPYGWHDWCRFFKEKLKYNPATHYCEKFKRCEGTS